MRFQVKTDLENAEIMGLVPEILPQGEYLFVYFGNFIELRNFVRKYEQDWDFILSTNDNADLVMEFFSEKYHILGSTKK